jgi:ADP-sugar diphosphatase
MLVILQPDDVPEGSEEEKYVLLTIQARVAGASLRFMELPAGMIDGDTLKSSATKEIEEELGLVIKTDELVNLSELALESSKKGEEETPQAFFPSAGGCDEYIQLFMYEKRIPRQELKEFTGKCTGVAEEGEKITLKLVKLEDLWIEGGRDAKALAACALLEGLKRTGKL